MWKNTHLDFLFSFLHGFLYSNMLPLVSSFWVYLSNLFSYVFESILGSFFRSSSDECFAENDYGEFSDSNFDELKQRQSSDQYVDQGNTETENSSQIASSSKYEFFHTNGFSGFIEEPKAESYTVHEFFMGSNERETAEVEKILEKEPEPEEPQDEGYTVHEFFMESNERETEEVDEEKTKEVEKVLAKEPDPDQPKAESFTVNEFYMDSNDLTNCNEQILFSRRETEEADEEKTEEFEKVLEPEPEESVLRFFFNRDFEKYIKQEYVEDIAKDSVEKLLEKPKHGQIELEQKTGESVENYIIEKSLEKHASDIQDNGGDHVEEKFVNFFEGPAIDMYLEKWHLKKDGQIFMFSQRNVVDVETITYEVLANGIDLRNQSHVVVNDDDDGQNVENTVHDIHECNSNKNISDSDEEFIELEPMSEKFRVMGDLSFEDEETESMVYDEEEDDDELLEQLKMEMKIARTGGLPTILEESSESPNMVEQLEPLNIDEKYDYKDHIAEIQKVYKGYSDKMRKLDILNSQAMHAIGLLQLKDPVRVSSAFGNSSAPAIKSLLSHNVWPFKQRKPEADPAMKLLRDLHMDFETVYVGQLCLSWEILLWQYGKLKRLSECDSFGSHQYNHVAGEFQRFQVLVHRFLEDEPFQNRPRVENYTKNRCTVRHLLQVPVIKDDCSKYKLEDAVLNEMLTDIIEESMHVFWEFLHADKDDANATSKTPQQAKVAPHDPIDLELLIDVRKDLQKKEKRFKEIQRSTNCIIKKFQRQHKGNLLDHALFTAQVELKLVSRVLNMLKISTDQLVWCHEKLQRINFRSRKIKIDPSFTLFPF